MKSIHLLTILFYSLVQEKSFFFTFLLSFISFLALSQTTKILLDRQVLSTDVKTVSIPVKVVDFTAVNKMDLVIEWCNENFEPIQDVEVSNIENINTSITYTEHTVSVSIASTDGRNIALPDSTTLFNLNFSVLTEKNELAILSILEDSQLSTKKNGQLTKLDYYPQDGYILVIPDGFLFWEESNTRQICKGDDYNGRHISGDYISPFLIAIGDPRVVSHAIDKLKLEVLEFSELDCINELRINIPEEYDYINIPPQEGYSILANQCSNIVKTEILTTTSEAFSVFNPTGFNTHNLLGPGINQYKYTFDNGDQMSTCNTTFDLKKSDLETDITGFKISDNKVRVGDKFIVDITAENIKDVYWFSMNLSWNFNKVNFLSVLSSPALEIYGYEFDTELVNEGKLKFTSANRGPLMNLHKETILFSIIFQATAQGDIEIEFEEGLFGSSSNGKGFNEDFVLYKNGEIEIKRTGICFDEVVNKTVQICQNESYEFRNQLFQSSGIYRDTLTGENGCDTIFQLTLTVANEATLGKASIREDSTTCRSNKTLFPTGYFQSIEAEWTTNNNDIILEPSRENWIKVSNFPFGDSKFYLTHSTEICPVFSIDSITITYTPLVTEITATILEGNNYILNNQTYNQSGNYQTTFVATNGCDNIVNLQLDVLPNPNGLCKITDTLYIPFDFSHVLTAESPLLALKAKLEMDHENVSIKRLDKDFPHPNIFRSGQNEYIFTYDSDGIKDSCFYSVEVVETRYRDRCPNF